MIRDADSWARVLVKIGVRLSAARRWAPVFSGVITDGTLSRGKGELDEFLGQVLHESGMLERIEEDLYYRSPERICAVWPRRFPTTSDALPFVCSPQKLATRVYSGRMGNVRPEDAWLYRGSGLIQITGAANFRAVQSATGLPIYDQPELMRTPGPVCLRASLAWWEGNIPDSITEDNDVTAETKRVNGGTIGLADRQSLTERARGALA